MIIYFLKKKTEYLTIQIIAKEKVEKWESSPQYGFDYDEDENSKTLRKTKMFYSFENKNKKKLEYIFWDSFHRVESFDILSGGPKRKLKSFCMEWERKEKET